MLIDVRPEEVPEPWRRWLDPGAPLEGVRFVPRQSEDWVAAFFFWLVAVPLVAVIVVSIILRILGREIRFDSSFLSLYGVGGCVLAALWWWYRREQQRARRIASGELRLGLFLSPEVLVWRASENECHVFSREAVSSLELTTAYYGKAEGVKEFRLHGTNGEVAAVAPAGWELAYVLPALLEWKPELPITHDGALAKKCRLALREYHAAREPKKPDSTAYAPWIKNSAWDEVEAGPEQGVSLVWTPSLAVDNNPLRLPRDRGDAAACFSTLLYRNGAYVDRMELHNYWSGTRQALLWIYVVNRPMTVPARQLNNLRKYLKDEYHRGIENATAVEFLEAGPADILFHVTETPLPARFTAPPPRQGTYSGFGTGAARLEHVPADVAALRGRVDSETYFAALATAAGIQIKLWQQRRTGMIDTPEVYAMDRPLEIQLRHVAWMIPQLASGPSGTGTELQSKIDAGAGPDDWVTLSSVSFESWTDFECLPDEF